MYSDAFLKLSDNQSFVSSPGDVTDNIIDLGSIRNMGVGEPLIAVISIRTAFTPDGLVDPLIQWLFYASELSTKADSTTAQELGRSAIYSANSLVLTRNLRAGAKICVPLLPVTTVRGSSTDFGATTIETKGRRYLYGAMNVTGSGDFLTGTFDIDICTQAQFGGGTDYSDVPLYATGITIA